ncbi:hypothetical protein FACS1894166_06720 [Bacilli bacterium]|nr:hypothetical protein FACS1894166_06720 [Bacilli bacterium]
MNTDQISDAVSNFSEAFIYTIYAVIILLSLINRGRKTVPVAQSKGQFPIGIIAIIGCFLASGYCVFYSYSFQFIRAGYSDQLSHSGLFLASN